MLLVLLVLHAGVAIGAAARRARMQAGSLRVRRQSQQAGMELRRPQQRRWRRSAGICRAPAAEAWSSGPDTHVALWRFVANPWLLFCANPVKCCHTSILSTVPVRFAGTIMLSCSQPSKRPSCSNARYHASHNTANTAHGMAVPNASHSTFAHAHGRAEQGSRGNPGTACTRAPIGIHTLSVHVRFQHLRNTHHVSHRRRLAMVPHAAHVSRHTHVTTVLDRNSSGRSSHKHLKEKAGTEDQARTECW